MHTKLLPLFLALTILTAACGLRIDLPVKTPGPQVIDEINIPAPDTTGNVHLHLSFGAGELALSSGSSQLVSGTATYNIPDLKPEITSSGNEVAITQGTYTLNGLPSFTEFVNKWSFKLGASPLDLEIDAGAYQAHYDFGGLALNSLTIRDGASDVELAFSQPNLVEMSFLDYQTGASNVTLNGLANANFSTMVFECGAGNYTLDFSGDLQRESSVTIKAGLGNLTLTIPAGISAVVNVGGGLSNVSFPSSWTHSGDVYTQTGSSPTLTIMIEIGAGNLTIRP